MGKGHSRGRHQGSVKLEAEDISIKTSRERDPTKLIPPYTALIKIEQDVHPFERLAFMPRREGR
jgi:hypothetical protein